MWFQQVTDYGNGVIKTPWDHIDFDGSDLSDIETRPHNVLQAIQGGQTGQYYHLTASELADIQSFFNRVGVVSVSTNYTFQATDRTVLGNSSSGDITITLPTAVGVTGEALYDVKHIGTGNVVTIAPNGSETIDGQTSIELIFPQDSITVQSDGVNWRII
jgi:hypothetical protein